MTQYPIFLQGNSCKNRIGYDRYCEIRKDRGYCTRRSKMWRLCKKTCFRCSRSNYKKAKISRSIKIFLDSQQLANVISTFFLQDSSRPCKNRRSDGYCERRKHIGYCTRRSKRPKMVKYCKKTCNKC